MRLVPSVRLAVAWTVVGVPALAIGHAVPSAAPIAMLAVAALVSLALADAALGLRAFDGVTAVLQPVTAMRKGIATTLDVTLMRAGAWRVAVAFPSEFDHDATPVDAAATSDGRASVAQLPVTPTARGRFAIDEVHVQSPTPLGLWEARTALPVDGEIRVHPDLATERRAAVFIDRGPAGSHARRVIGKGREFEKLRDYQPGDGYDEIHWKATARRGKPVTKVFQVERTRRVHVVIDASRLSGRPAREPTAATGATRPATVLERYVSAAMILAEAAGRQDDLFGLMTFSDTVHRAMPAGHGPRHQAACRDALLGLAPRMVAPDFDELFARVRMGIRSRSLIVVLTCLDDPAVSESFLRGLEAVRGRHLLVVASIAPAGARAVFDPAADPVNSSTDLYGRLAGQLQWSDRRLVAAELARRGVRVLDLDELRLGAQLVAEYAGLKARQAL